MAGGGRETTKRIGQKVKQIGEVSWRNLLKIKVRYYGYLQLLFGRLEEEMVLPAGATVNDLLQELRAKIPTPEVVSGREPAFFLSPEDLLLGINGRRLSLNQGRDHLLQEGDIIDLFPPLGGGAERVGLTSSVGLPSEGTAHSRGEKEGQVVWD